MSTSEQHAGETPTDEYAAEDNAYGMRGRPTDIATGRKAARPKVTLSAIVTCPGCGSANKPEWLYKSRHGDSYSTTMWCEQCGSLIAIWATQVDAQIVTHTEAT